MKRVDVKLHRETDDMSAGDQFVFANGVWKQRHPFYDPLSRNR
jgi:hypothetical protein